MSSDASGVTDNGRGRFEMAVEGGTAFVTYREERGALALLHAEVPSAVEGRGEGSRLVKGTLDQVRARGQKVIPYCPFISIYIRRHPEYQDLLAE